MSRQLFGPNYRTTAADRNRRMALRVHDHAGQSDQSDSQVGAGRLDVISDNATARVGPAENLLLAERRLEQVR